MTREEASNILDDYDVNFDGHTAEEIAEAFEVAFRTLEQEPCDFAKWVATEIFDENWEYNKGAFEELACRKLAKLGIVRAKGDEWELVDPQETETWNGYHGQITAPKGTFEKIYEDAESEE